MKKAVSGAMAALAFTTSCAAAPPEVRMPPKVAPAPVAAPITTSAAPITTSAAPVTTSRPAPPPCGRTAAACVSLSQLKAWLVRDGKVARGPVPIKPGSVAEPTPVGVFRVAWKNRHQTSNEFGTPMPNSVFFAAGGIAFHEGSLDTPSHGCVHLSSVDSAAFFDGLGKGDVVEVVP
ncbi:L,D-transpeptidase [Amycolatopsis sp. CA-230715]|uniref:L,D-transpeptidase n=1 Tax=Amycolatopsis sp. CA-230715 TaxID=2745196 RepID=UPI001C023F58|nr:L,D-transpeptidase [Amycolatopsis sp. CA-230715]QWF82771.1 hypothetical protein HUW46_06210 [Amycolatopsis sp. CA-230715]